MSSYHFLFVVRDGKIQQVKGYLYTVHATSVLRLRYSTGVMHALESERAASEWSASIETSIIERQTKVTNGGAMYVAGGSKEMAEEKKLSGPDFSQGSLSPSLARAACCRATPRASPYWWLDAPIPSSP